MIPQRRKKQLSHPLFPSYSIFYGKIFGYSSLFSDFSPKSQIFPFPPLPLSFFLSSNYVFLLFRYSQLFPFFSFSSTNLYPLLICNIFRLVQAFYHHIFSSLNTSYLLFCHFPPFFSLQVPFSFFWFNLFFGSSVSLKSTARFIRLSSQTSIRYLVLIEFSVVFHLNFSQISFPSSFSLIFSLVIGFQYGPLVFG